MVILRRKLVRRAGVVLALLAALVVACLCLWPDRPGTFTKANFDRITEGMSFGEVEAIVGPPVGVEPIVNPPTPEVVSSLLLPVVTSGSGCHWDSDSADGYVLFDNSGVVCGKGYARKPLAVTLRLWWFRAFGRPAPF